MRRVFRVCRAIYARLDGEGARRVGARWNSPGYPVVYMAESVSLAVLENLVHMSRDDFPTGYVVVGAIIPNTVDILSEEQLRISFGALPPQLLGDRWIKSLSSAVLRVSSAVVPNESNYLLNPKHPAFPQIVTEIPVPYFFDRRLFST